MFKSYIYGSIPVAGYTFLFSPLLIRNKELRRHVYELQPDNNDLNYC